MNDSAVKELKKYIFFGSIGQFIMYRLRLYQQWNGGCLSIT